MGVLYRDDDFFDLVQQSIREDIKFCTQGCIPFNIYFGKESDKWGIWLKTECGTFLIDCIELMNSIFRDGEFLILGDRKTAEHIEIRQQKYCYQWWARKGLTKEPQIWSFSFDEYIGKIQKCTETLYTAMRNKYNIAYTDPEVNINTVGMMVEQLRLRATMPSYFRITTKEVVEEKFTIEFPTDDENNEFIIFSIGNRHYKALIEHYCNPYEAIRHQLERFVFFREATIEWGDCMDVIGCLKINKDSVLKEKIDYETGTAFRYKDYAIVEVQPRSFDTYAPTIKGYCDLNQALTTLYEGFLRLALRHKPSMTKQEYMYADEPTLLDAYNIFKSPLIEHYIMDLRTDDRKPQIRQTTIKNVLTIRPDVDEVLWNMEGMGIDIDEKGYIDGVYDKQGQPIRIAGLKKWKKEIFPLIVESELGKLIVFDWADYHKRGLALAQKLRDKLSDDFDLWYEAPFEDKSGIIPCKRLIYPSVAKKDKNYHYDQEN